MQHHHLAAVFLATAIWTIFTLGMVFWTPPSAQEGVRLAAGADRAPHRAILLRAAVSGTEARR